GPAFSRNPSTTLASAEAVLVRTPTTAGDRCGALWHSQHCEADPTQSTRRSSVDQSSWLWVLAPWRSPLRRSGNTCGGKRPHYGNRAVTASTTITCLLE